VIAFYVAVIGMVLLIAPYARNDPEIHQQATKVEVDEVRIGDEFKVRDEDLYRCAACTFNWDSVERGVECRLGRADDCEGPSEDGEEVNECVAKAK
jgi:hypothetical protein